jgi:O-antigen/teichoic acid export membrane protein
MLSYKRTVLYADQKEYTLNMVHMGYLIVLNIMQIIFLYLTHNYYYYLLIKIVVHVIENLVISYIVNIKYNYLKEKNVRKLDKDTEKKILRNIKALFTHKIGTFVINGTDNIIISKFIGIVAVGLYSNYYLIINSVQILFNQIISSVTSSVGTMLITESKEKQFDVFTKVRFLSFWIACFSGISIYILIDNFIAIWIGKEFILPLQVLLVLILNYYQFIMRSSYMSFKTAAGIFYEDRFIPIIESLINVIASIILLHYFGLAGVFMGTAISSLIIWCYSYPKFVYKKLFNRSYVDYVRENIGYLMLFIGIIMFTNFIAKFISFDSLVIMLLVKGLVCLIIPNLLLSFVFRKSRNFSYFVNLINKYIFKKIIQKETV